MAPTKPQQPDKDEGDRSGRFVWGPDDLVFDDEPSSDSSEEPTADIPTKPIEDVTGDRFVEDV